MDRRPAPGVGNLELREAPQPVPGENEVLVRVEACGICGSDLHVFNWDTKVTTAPPVIIGHEFAGTVVQAPPSSGVAVGDLVTGEPTYSVCGRCLHCQAGFYNLCAQRKVLGFAADGAFAEYVRLPAHRVHRLPGNVQLRAAALSEPLACCVHALYELTGIEVNELAVVSGPGAMGLLSAQLLKAAGARVLVVGTAADRARLELAGRLGADWTLELGADDPVQRVSELTGGVGADIVVDCSGAAAAANLGLDLVRKRGKYTQLGLFGAPVTIDFERIAYKEIRMTGSFAQKWSAWTKALALVARGQVQLEPLVSDVLPLRDWQVGFDKLNAKQGLKVLLTPD